MIIKNNFNAKDANPLMDYKEIGKGRDSLDHFNDEKVNNQVIQDILNKDKEYQEDDEEVRDNWDFFK